VRPERRRRPAVLPRRPPAVGAVGEVGARPGGRGGGQGVEGAVAERGGDAAAVGGGYVSPPE